MQTETLIKSLAARAEPVPDGIVPRQLALAFAFGLAASFLIQIQTGGVRTDVDNAWFEVLWKVLACIGVGVVWAIYLRALSAPGLKTATQRVVAVAVCVLVGAAALLAPHDFDALRACVSQVLMLSVPALLVLLWVMRKAAPMQPGRTGFALGIAAGAIGAFGYSLGCLTDEPAIVAFRYGSAILATGVVGLVLGRFFLKW